LKTIWIVLIHQEILNPSVNLLEEMVIRPCTVTNHATMMVQLTSMNRTPSVPLLEKLCAKEGKGTHWVTSQLTHFASIMKV
jgi:hypothetical protein